MLPGPSPGPAGRSVRRDQAAAEPPSAGVTLAVVVTVAALAPRWAGMSGDSPAIDAGEGLGMDMARMMAPMAIGRMSQGRGHGAVLGHIIEAGQLCMWPQLSR